MRLTELAIRRPVLLWMALAALGILGTIGYLRLPAELNPRVDIPTLTVTTVYPGAGPREVENLVTRPIEDAVSAVSGLRDVFSLSQEGYSIVSLDLRIGTDLNAAVAAVRDAVEGIRTSLPAGALPPVTARLDLNAQPVLYAALTSNRPSEELSRVVERTVRPLVARVDGVATVTLTGLTRREVLVEVRAEALRKHGLTIADIVNSLKAGGAEVPAGSLEQGRVSLGVRTVAAFGSVEEMRRTQILTPALLQSGAAVPGMPAERTLPVLLEEVASVREAPADPETLTRMNGRESIGLIITKQSDANTISVVDGVQQRLRELSSDVLKGVDIVVSRDESLTVRDALEDVNATLILGAVLAMTVVFLFLHNLRGTVIVALALPLCLVATFLVMYVLGFTLNQMTLLALSLSVGILIDDSIVVLESITRHLGLGEPPDEAALNGRTEIGFADITTTLVDVVVFLPIAFMGGIVGGFFRQFGIVIVVSTLFSLLVSFTVTPTLSARWYRHGENPEAGTGIFAPLESLLQKLSGAYRRLLSGALRNRPWVLAFAVVTVVSTMLFSVPGLGFEFLPATDAGQISVTVELPPDASLAATDRTTRQVEKLLQSVPEVRSTATVVGEVLAGFGSFPRRGPQFAQISIRLRDRAGLLERITHFGAVPDGMRTRGDAEIAADIRRRLRSVVGAQIGVTPVRAVANAGLPIQLQLRGDDLELLNRTASAVQQKLASTAGVIEPDLSTRAGRPEAQLKIDRGTAAAMGVAPGIAAAALRDAVTGNTEVSLRRAGEDLPVRVRADRHDTATAEALERLPIAVAGGRAVEAREVGRLQPGTGVTGIERVNGRRMVQITANLAPGFALGNTQKQIERAIAGVVPAGVEVHFGGEAEQMEENIPYFALALGLAVALVYLVMAGLFNNLLNPLVILFTLPMALAGAMAGLAITGESLSLVSMIGIIMLTGLMGRNAILLLDYTATLRARGCDRTTALLEAGATRLRPILMTTFATIVGMLPVALRIGRASELRAPMAVVVIGGLLVSTVLTLVVIPVLYSVADDWATRLRRNIGTR